MIRPLLLAASLLLAPAIASAQEITTEDREAIDARVEQLDAAMKSGDLLAATEVVPPSVFETMAETAGVSLDELRAAMREALDGAMDEVEIVSYEMRPDEAETAETSTGRPYLLIPTETVIRASGTTVRSTSSTLALKDEEAWYLVRVDDVEQIELLQQIYSDFAGVEFPSGSMSLVE